MEPEEISLIMSFILCMYTAVIYDMLSSDFDN